jgi:CRP/FNR family transcriptional regulator
LIQIKPANYFWNYRMISSAEQILSDCHFFAGVKGEQRRRLVEMAVLREYGKSTMIFREGDPCPGVFIVGSGLVRVFKMSPAGKEHVLHLVGPGSTFAEVAAIGAFDCPAFAQALEDSRCVLLPLIPFSRAMHEDHTLCLQLMASMARWVKHLVGLVEDVVLRDAAGRTARYLLEAPRGVDGSVRLPSLKKHLASHLNLTGETLSRTLRRLEDLGLITSDADRGIVVVNAAGLQLAAEEGV